MHIVEKMKAITEKTALTASHLQAARIALEITRDAGQPIPKTALASIDNAEHCLNEVAALIVGNE